MPPRLLSLPVRRRTIIESVRLLLRVRACTGLPHGFADRRSGLALAATVRMVARVHHRPADGWPSPAMPVAPSFPNHDIFVVDVAHLAERRHAIEVDEPHFRRQWICA